MTQDPKTQITITLTIHAPELKIIELFKALSPESKRQLLEELSADVPELMVIDCTTDL